MKKLIFEIENIHTGKITTTSQTIDSSTEEGFDEVIKMWRKSLSRMHMTSNDKLSRLYYI